MDVSIQIPDITQEQVIEAMAARLLGDPYQRDDEFDPEDPTPRPTSWDRKAIGKHLRQYFEARIKETVENMVAEAVDQAISAEIASEVRRVCTEGWQTTDEYGRPKERKTMSDLVLKSLTMPVHYSSYSSTQSTLAERVMRDTIEDALKRGFSDEIKRAQDKFREQFDALIQAKFADTIKSALGLR